MKNYLLLLPFLVCLSISACQPTGKSSSTTTDPPCDRCAVIVDDIWSGLVGDGAKSTAALVGEPDIIFTLVKDGGKCYFQMKVNVSKEEVYDFMINGNG